MESHKKYGMYKGKFVGEMSRDELLEVVLAIGAQNWELRNKPCVHEQIATSK